jgi:hypothetical protein
VVELDLPTEARCMAPRFGGDWLSWVEVTEEDGWVLAAARLASVDEPERVVLGTAEEGEWFVNWADRPVMSVGANGAWIASWLRTSGEGAYAYDAVVAVSIDQGKRWTNPAKLHSDKVEGEHGFVSLLPREGAGWAACWLDGRAMGGGHDDHGHPAGDMQLRFAHVDMEGQPVEERVLDERVCECCPTAMAPLPGGGAVIIYRDRGAREVRDFSYVYCTDRKLDRWSSPRAVHEDGWRVDGCPVNGAALATHGERLAVAWFTLGTDDTPRVLCAWWDAKREAFGDPVRVDAGEPLGRIDAAMLPSGEVAITWLAKTEGPDAAEWRLAVGSDAEGGFESQALLETSASRASGISALRADGEELIFSHTRAKNRAVRILRLMR